MCVRYLENDFCPLNTSLHFTSSSSLGYFLFLNYLSGEFLGCEKASSVSYAAWWFCHLRFFSCDLPNHAAWWFCHLRFFMCVLPNHASWWFCRLCFFSCVLQNHAAWWFCHLRFFSTKQLANQYDTFAGKKRCFTFFTCLNYLFSADNESAPQVTKNVMLLDDFATFAFFRMFCQATHMTPS